MSRWVQLRWPDSQVTRSDARGSSNAFASGRVPYKVKYHISALATAPQFLFRLAFLSFCRSFLVVSRIFLAYFVLFCPLSHFQVFCSLLYLLFSVILTVSMLLWNIFKIKTAYLYL